MTAPRWWNPNPPGNFGERAVIVLAMFVDAFSFALSWGHIYPDLALRALSWQLERTIDRAGDYHA
jgi:hypothetical protein